MTEWGVVGVIVALLGFVTAIVGPLTKLTQSITKLTVVVDRLDKEQQEQRSNAKKSHQDLWNKCKEQDESINDHETRIQILEDHEKEK